MLDFNSLQIASIISRIAFVMVFVVTMIRQRREIYFGMWAAALCCSLIASFTMLGDPPNIPLESAKGGFVFALYGSSIALSWVGLRLFYDRPAVIFESTALAFLPGLSYSLVLNLGFSQNFSLSLVFGFIAMTTGLCILEIVRTGQSVRLWTQYVVVVGFAGYFCAFLLSIFVLNFANERFASSESSIFSLLFDMWCGVFIQVGYIAMVSERANLRLSLLAETDPLTGLANRRGLFALVGRKTGIVGFSSGCAVLLVDIDHFKSINDRFGHDVGDSILVLFAERVLGIVRQHDVVARWGGEEFLILLEDVDTTIAASIAERLRSETGSQSFTVNGRTLIVTVSVGVAFLEAGEKQIETALSRADAALYNAKKCGRNRVCLEEIGLPTQQSSNFIWNETLSQIC